MNIHPIDQSPKGSTEAHLPHLAFLLECAACPYSEEPPVTMFIKDYYNEQQGGICFTRKHASDFAKHIADDFNPIHDIDAKRFCVPGDLLFSIVLAKYGLSQHMEFIFSGMVTEGVDLLLPEPSSHMEIKDRNGREYLSIKRSGDNSADEKMIEKMTRSYVAFSGHTFPHILVPLTAKHNVMINANRPMVIYESMSIGLDRLDLQNPTLQVDHNELEMTGKRGNALLAFNILEDDKIVGRGQKRMVLSGLREYHKAEMDDAIETYLQRKKHYFESAIV